MGWLERVKVVVGAGNQNLAIGVGVDPEQQLTL